MAKLSLWKPRKGKDYNFIDTVAREQFYVGSVSILIHKYLGPIDQGDKDDPAQPSEAQSETFDVTTIQDVTFNEIRNRKYSDDVFELRGHFSEADKDFDLLQMGLTLTNGTKFITFHLNDMLDKLGRKLMPGDVLEMPNLRDDALLDEESPAVNQWYVIKDASWPSEGFGPTWFPHMWRVKAEPLNDAPEYYDITKDEEGNSDPLIDLLSTYNREITENDKVVEKAEQDVPERNFETRQIYIVEDDEFGSQYPWIFAGDGVPPNNSVLADTGTAYPDNPTVGDYFLRTDYEPSKLYQWNGGKWRFVEINFRKSWNKAHRVIESHINNDNTFEEDGETINERQPISKAVKPKTDFGDN